MEKSVTGVERRGDCLFNDLLSELSVSLGGREQPSLDEAISRLSRETEQLERRSGGRSRHGGTPSGPADARLCPQHDPQRACDRGPLARLLELDLGPQPRERDPGRGGAEPRGRDRRPLRHPAALLRPKARCSGCRGCPTTTARRRSRRSAARSRGTTRGTSSSGVRRLLPAAGDIVGRFLKRDWIDAGRAAREDARRLLRHVGAGESPPTCS